MEELKSISIISPYSEFFWSIVSNAWIDTGHLSVFSPNAGKYRTEKLQIQILFTQCTIRHFDFVIITGTSLVSKFQEHFLLSISSCISFRGNNRAKISAIVKKKHDKV